MNGRSRRTAAGDAEAAARSSYGRLLSIVAARSGDIASAEDALADAFAAALEQWPRDGVPGNPLGWLIAVARRRAGRSAERDRTAVRGAQTVLLLHAERAIAGEPGWSDRRLELMFACTHPAIALEVQAPLMLQTVLGVDAATIAASYLISPASMGQRLVRAKRRIRDTGIAFRVPDASDLAERIEAVLSAIYAAYGTAWDDVMGADGRLAGLADEAIWLARVLVRLLPDEPEPIGLLALMLYCEARRPARRDADGEFVPLLSQDTSLWEPAKLREAESLLRDAAAKARPGRFQTEAAIQSLHVQQRLTGERFAYPLARLYDVLAGFAPTAGALSARAVAHAECGNAVAALGMLDAIEGIEGYQPWWAARARIASLAGDAIEAERSAAIAAGLTSDPAIRRFLLDGAYRHRD
ncbi:RNA polymerase sigma factor [Sphingomonas japonica]|uniref:RNA polymerase sigma-70 factor (ECF subfamily) n=1 Tax=Sphingomonas japonica TaxID=511662 RepID=A0ABX0U8H9_9SPHN|nr:DUF6596 domain-containing protein [Sphingomonas japonica]NIJ25112.1 RNA polymerase sigma-70 factor (ECF subfamily) [Sphingomonas japonica]